MFKSSMDFCGSEQIIILPPLFEQVKSADISEIIKLPQQQSKSLMRWHSNGLHNSKITFSCAY